MVKRFLLSAALYAVFLAATPGHADPIQFGGKYYVRDLGTNTARAVGDAWVKRGLREMYADKIEIDFATNRAIATGNVRIRDSKLLIYCGHADWNLQGEDAILADARILTGQTVVTGTTINRIDHANFEVLEGTFTNCNTELTEDPGVAACSFDWKIHGRRFRITFGGYAHFYDVLLFAKNLPLLYLPYMLVPVKTERQSGVLKPSFLSTGNAGSGFSLPLYVVLGSWHDATFTPTTWSKYGMQYAMNYRYAYSPTTDGSARIAFFSKRYGTIDNPQVLDPTKPLTFGVIGEWSVNFANRVGLWGRAQTRQVVRLLSNPYYPVDFPGDVAPWSDLGYLRSMVSFSQPGDTYYLGTQAEYFQSLAASLVTNPDPTNPVPLPTGIDGGSVAELPKVLYSRPSFSLLERYVNFEFDGNLTNYYRPQAFDRVPSNGTLTGPTPWAPEDPNRPFIGPNDYLRSGRRLILEPRLVLSVPLASGFQFQPIFGADEMAYNFDYPNPAVVRRESAWTEIPFSLYLSRTYDTGIPSMRRINHVFQPRITYAASLYNVPDPDHPFFYQQTAPVSLINPRFDLRDFVTDYEYTRIELINRFRRKSDSGNTNRFFLLQIAEQFNSRVNPLDPRYAKHLGPIEMLAGLTLDQVSAQFQATQQLEATTTLNSVPLGVPVLENAYSGSVQVRWAEKDNARFTALLTRSADPTITEQLTSLYIYKQLPTFFDVDGQVEYSFWRGILVSYQIGLYFAAKPRSCWRFSLVTGRNAFNVPFFNFNFQLDFSTAAPI